MKSIFVLYAVAFLFTTSQAVDLYSLTAHDAVGNVVALEQYRGKVRTLASGGCTCAHSLSYRCL